MMKNPKRFLIFVGSKIIKRNTMERYSMKEVIKTKVVESEKKLKTTRSTKRATEKASKSKGGKYEVKIVDGVKYMVLK